MGEGVLSASLGYNVTRSTTTTAAATHKVPRHHLGIGEWRSLFSTQAVHQRQYRRRCTQFGCPRGWSVTNRYETAYASRYTGPDCREAIH